MCICAARRGGWPPISLRLGRSVHSRSSSSGDPEVQRFRDTEYLLPGATGTVATHGSVTCSRRRHRAGWCKEGKGAGVRVPGEKLPDPLLSLSLFVLPTNDVYWLAVPATVRLRGAAREAHEEQSGSLRASCFALEQLPCRNARRSPRKTELVLPQRRQGVAGLCAIAQCLPIWQRGAGMLRVGNMWGGLSTVIRSQVIAHQRVRAC